MMNRNTLNFLVDFVGAVLGVALVLSGLMIRYVLPAGSGRSHLFWNLGRHDWGDVHFWMAVGLGLLVLVHVALHWQWVCVTLLRLVRPRHPATRPYPGRPVRCAAGAAVLVVLAALLAGLPWAAWREVEKAGGTPGASLRADAELAGHGVSSNGGGAIIRGSMTLDELASTLGVPLPVVRKTLGIAADTPPDERLGHLCRDYGFSMQQLRDAVGANGHSHD